MQVLMPGSSMFKGELRMIRNANPQPQVRRFFSRERLARDQFCFVLGFLGARVISLLIEYLRQ